MCKLRILVASLILVLVLTSGVGAEPSQLLTRGEFAAQLVEAAGLEGEGEPAELLVAAGIMKGAPGGELNLAQPITRIEAVALVARTLGMPDDVMPASGVEVPLAPSHWGHSLYTWFIRLGLESGDPTAVLTPAEGAALLERSFTTPDDVLTLLERSQEVTKDLTAMSTTVSGSMKLTSRPGVDEAEEIQALTTTMRVQQDLVLPDRLHQVTEMKMEIPGLGTQEFITEAYMVDGKMYQQIPNPETGELAWFRYPEGEMPDLSSLIEQAQQQSSVIPPGLENDLFYRLLGTKEIAGEAVYEIAFWGRIDDLNKFMAAVMGQYGDMASLTESMAKASEMIDTMSFWGISYVGVEDYLTRCGEYNTVVRYSDQFQGEEMPIESMQMFMLMEDYKYGDDIKVEVPEEVLSAPELPFPVQEGNPEEPQPEPAAE
jgi:hypothetical protein